MPAAALLAVMVVRSHFPYWLALVLALLTTTVGGAIIEMFVIRRLSKAPRVIVLVATIGVAELMQAIVRTLPDYQTGKFQTVFPTPISTQWKISSLFHLHSRRRPPPDDQHRRSPVRRCSRSSSCRS